LPLDANFWAQDDPVEARDRGQSIATLWTIGRYPLMSAGLLPLDALTLSYLTNPTALLINNRSEDAAAPTRVHYEGNCTCSGGLVSCTIPHGADDHPAQPCVAKWIARVPSLGGATALSLSNIGEDNATSATGFAELGLPTGAAARYRVTDVWSGAAVGDFSGDESFSFTLRKHASVLVQVAALSSESLDGK
jgi:Alpha galactosidase C-terminal beta sandwich domain